MVVTHRLMGGLGNQLFQIFTTISYALKYKRSFIFKYDDLSTGRSDRTTFWNTLFMPIMMYTQQKYPSEKYPLTDITHISEQSFDFHDLPVPNITDKNIALHGYFQSEQYFIEKYKDIYDLIRIDFQKNLLKKAYPEYDFQNLVSLHFRLGDYKKLPDVHPIMNYEYYQNSVQYIVNNSENRHFLYFCEKEDNDTVSNIIEKLKQTFNDCFFIKADDTIIDWKQLLMMSCCQHNIIANSSFSWWGAYFNSNEKKIVCYPDVWFGKNMLCCTKDLCPPQWIQQKNK